MTAAPAVVGACDVGCPRRRQRQGAVMLVSEQPGDQEDLTGRPFVGPAGRLLDAALERRGSCDQVYVTNVVKHFSWIPRGKRRIHKTPTQAGSPASTGWKAERRLVNPRIIVCLGATAAKALLGRDFRVSVQRGQLIEGGIAPFMLATVPPSSLCASNEGRAQKEAFDRRSRRSALIVRHYNSVAFERFNRCEAVERADCSSVRPREHGA